MMMESTDLEVLSTTLRWREEGSDVVLVTVVKTWGSSPRPPGSLLAIREDGLLCGSVSGGCIEEDLRARIKGAMPTRAEVVTYGVTREESRRIGLPCGGTLELVMEPLGDVDRLRALVTALRDRDIVRRRLHLADGSVTLLPAEPGYGLDYDGKILATTHGPSWRLLLIGAGQLSRYLAEMALALDYEVIVCDPREEYLEAWSVEGVSLDRGMPDDVVRARASDIRSAVVTLTHDPKLDDMALLEALISDAFYVGALGSRASTEKRRERLASLDVPEAALASLHGPVGLPIGSKTPPEIAVSILAELTAVRRGIQLCVSAP
jgi:xanthine dehydrogenase accessory factor